MLLEVEQFVVSFVVEQVVLAQQGQVCAEV